MREIKPDHAVLTVRMATSLRLANERPEQGERARAHLSIDTRHTCQHGSEVHLRWLHYRADLPILGAFLSQNLIETADLMFVFGSVPQCCAMLTKFEIAPVNTTEILLSDGCNISTCSSRGKIAMDD